MIPTLYLVTLCECLRDIRRDIRRARFWGLTPSQAKALLKMPFKKLLMLAHLCPKPLFTLHKAASLQEADHQKAELRELWIRQALTFLHDPIEYRYWFMSEATLAFDPIHDDQKLRFHIVFLDPEWLEKSLTLMSFMKPRYYIGFDEAPKQPAALIEDEAFLELIESTLPHELVAHLFGVTESQVRDLRRQWVEPKRFLFNKGPQIRQLAQHKADRVFLFEGLKHFLARRQEGLTTTQSFYRALRQMKSLPLYRFASNAAIDLATNLYWTLVVYGQIASPLTEEAHEKLLLRLTDLIGPLYTQPITDREPFRSMPTFEPIPFASSKTQTLVAGINRAILERDFSQQRLYQLLKEEPYETPHRLTL